MFAYEVQETDLQQRADVLIQRQVPQLSRGFIKKLAGEGKLSFRSKPIVAGYKLKNLGDLKLDYDLKALDNVPYLKLNVIFEDQDLMVINKPTGIIVHARANIGMRLQLLLLCAGIAGGRISASPAALADLRMA